MAPYVITSLVIMRTLMLKHILQASRRIERDWADGEEGKSIKTDSQLEKKIARLQECVEVVLNRFKVDALSLQEKTWPLYSSGNVVVIVSLFEERLLSNT